MLLGGKGLFQNVNNGSPIPITIVFVCNCWFTSQSGTHTIKSGTSRWSHLFPSRKNLKNAAEQDTKTSYKIEISVKSGKDSTKYPELVIHRVRFKKNLQKKYISMVSWVILVVNWVSSCLSFFLSASTAAATYIFTAPNCTTTIISLELCAY